MSIMTTFHAHQDHEYLIKWEGWPLQDCSWEPSENLPKKLIRGYKRPPKPREERLQEAAYHFAGRILSALKNSAISPFYVYIHLDVWRYLTCGKGTASQHRGHVLYSKHDFERFTALPEHWWYYLDEHGEGRVVDFPIKIKPLLTWSPAHHIKRAGRLVKAPRFPIEKLSVTMVKRACNLQNLDQ
ncbi:hypothetical protein P5673_032547 [Acropora cervicornis]|uniref:Chromo domain-containing protein n=1 Tax=Acropora cervicornis TaxID=6130 RepID=A0AAD9PRE2_ACRCE|nr:hypothetical protein P5673_032547 [Acropora cervicornis]